VGKIGGNGRVREELIQALADGRGVTAKIRWISRKSDTEGRQRWIHCTPLPGNNGAIGVWMIVIADDENLINDKRFKLAPPVDPKFGRAIPFGNDMDDSGSLRGFARANGARTSHSSTGMSAQGYNLDGDSEHGSATGSAYMLRID